MRIAPRFAAAALALLAAAPAPARSFEASGGDAAPAADVWIDKAEDEGYTARHECSFVQAGDRFFLFGGRENAQTLDTYDFATDTWDTSASAPIAFNHFQATEYEGLVWVIGAFETNNFPNEDPADAVYVFDPARDVWLQGPAVPVARRRGSAGLAVHAGKFYVVAGNTIGHNGGYVPWFDVYDPEDGTWTALDDAPGPRDHFHAAVTDDELFVVGGRLSGGPEGTFAPLVPEVDVYDFATETWTTLPPASDLPTPRAAASVAYFDDRILVIGGEGNGQAYATVEAFDPLTNGWKTRASLHHARHGTQAIVSGGGVYVTAGSPNQGGGNQRNMEVYSADAPSGAVSVAGVLAAPALVPVAADTPTAISFTHVSGNVGVFVMDVSLSGADAGDFAVISAVSEPFLVPTSSVRDITVAYGGTVDGASASLDVTYGGGELASVTLLPEPGSLASLLAGALVLAALRALRTRRGDATGHPAVTGRA